MTHTPKIECTGEVIAITGDLTFNTVPPAYEQLQKFLVKPVSTLDLSGVNATDSSAISLLLSCQELILDNDKPLHIVGASKSILSLMNLYGVESFIPGGVDGRPESQT